MVTDRLPPGTFVVVSGPPASGKTTLARAVAPALGLPLIAKDTIKEALMAVLPVPDVAASRVVGRASVAALLAVAAESGGAAKWFGRRRARPGTIAGWTPSAPLMTPPEALCDRVLYRLFPDAPAGTPRWETLLWATGRGELGGRARLAEWRWHGSPR